MHILTLNTTCLIVNPTPPLLQLCLMFNLLIRRSTALESLRNAHCKVFTFYDSVGACPCVTGCSRSFLLYALQSFILEPPRFFGCLSSALDTSIGLFPIGLLWAFPLITSRRPLHSSPSSLLFLFLLLFLLFAPLLTFTFTMLYSSSSLDLDYSLLDFSCLFSR